MTARESIAKRLRMLERTIDERTHGRTSGIFVQVLEDRLIVHGRATTHHVKQLVLEAIGKIEPDLRGTASTLTQRKCSRNDSVTGDCLERGDRPRPGRAARTTPVR